MFSVVIPLFNKAHTIRRTLSTVLAQTFPHFEILIVNDGSTDNGVNVIKEFTSDPRIHIVVQDNQGECAARNKGAFAAKYKYIAFLDADDEWFPDYLAKMKEAVSLFPNAGMYCCGGIVRDKNGDHLRLARKYKGQIVEINYFENPHVFSNMSAVTVSKTQLEKTQGFPVGMKCNGDYVLLYSLALISTVVYCGEILSIYNGNVPGQITSVSKEKKFVFLGDVTNRINLCHELWQRTNCKNNLYITFEKYDARARILSFLRAGDYKSLNYFLDSLSVNVKSNYSKCELFLYRSKMLMLLAKMYIYFTKIIWRTNRFPVVGTNKTESCLS